MSDNPDEKIRVTKVPLQTMSGNSLPRLGDYLLIERIGEGGMAEVFRAQYSGDEHSVGPMSVVVVKRIKPDLFN